jgi:hypothetical protein
MKQSAREAAKGQHMNQAANQRTVFGGVGVIIVAVAVTFMGLALFLQNRCVTNFNDGIFEYPNAEIVQQESAFLGVQRVVYATDDPPADVESWYAQQRASLQRQAVESGDFSNIPQDAWLIVPNESNGTHIIFETTCP